MAKFRHPNIVRVMSVFEANNTAYMVMEYERGESFENMLKFKQVGGEQTLKNILLPLLDGLELAHDAEFILRQARFVLDAMKLRKWPHATYDALFAEYREADQLLEAARWAPLLLSWSPLPPAGLSAWPEPST